MTTEREETAALFRKLADAATGDPPRVSVAPKFLRDMAEIIIQEQEIEQIHDLEIRKQRHLIVTLGTVLKEILERLPDGLSELPGVLIARKLMDEVRRDFS